MLQLYRTLIRSKFEYSSPLWNPSLVCDIDTIEDVQRFVTNRISGMSDLSYWDRLTALKIQSIQRRRERNIIIHTWKTITGHVPNDLDSIHAVCRKQAVWNPSYCSLLEDMCFYRTSVIGRFILRLHIFATLHSIKIINGIFSKECNESFAYKSKFTD